MNAKTHNGYLIIGDISGYTSYVAATELEHSQAVLTELLELIVNQFRPLLTVVKLEGDAVFAHAPEAQIPRGESLLDLIESTYIAFRDRIKGIVLHTTCECEACRAIPMLDLKFMVHFGDYIIQNISGINDLIGSDVNLVHRLTKNHITEATGWNAYALFTDTSLEQMNLPSEGMHEQVETYEHLGAVNTYNLDLRSRYKELVEGRQVLVRSEEADFTLEMTISAPRPIVWEWLTDPHTRNRYIPGASWSAYSRPGGRTGVGASNHCAHGKDAMSAETILDWRPYDYYTVDSEAKLGQESSLDTLQTINFIPCSDDRETEIRWYFKLKRPNFFARLAFRLFVLRNMKQVGPIMKEMLQAEMSNRVDAPTGLLVPESSAPATGGE
jgi:carbon monoxide dehydrogenase subunit G